MKIGILTISDSRSFETDESGKVIIEFSKKEGWTVDKYSIVPDEKKLIFEELKNIVNQKVNLILTTGGTGVAKRDVTPEATKSIIEKEVPGIGEAIRTFSAQKTQNAMLSRGIAGIINETLIINLPGSKKAVTEILPFLKLPIIHCIDLLTGKITQH